MFAPISNFEALVNWIIYIFRYICTYQVLPDCSKLCVIIFTGPECGKLSAMGIIYLPSLPHPQPLQNIFRLVFFFWNSNIWFISHVFINCWIDKLWTIRECSLRLEISSQNFMLYQMFGTLFPICKFSLPKQKYLEHFVWSLFL